MKKIFILIIGIIFSLGLFNPVEVFAEGNEKTSIAVSDKDTEAGTTVQVDVSIKNNKGILGGTFKVSYDSGLTLKSASAGEAFAALTFTKPGVYENGCKFVWDSTNISENDIKDGIILSLIFDVDSEANVNDKYTIKVECEDAVDTEMNPLNIEIGSGNVNIVDSDNEKELDSISVEKTKTTFNVNEELTIDDLIVTALYKDKTEKTVTNYLTNVSDIDMSVAGVKKLIISFTDGKITKSADIEITVKDAEVSSGTKITIDSNVALPGDQIEINLSVSDNPGILGLTLKIQFDTKLTLTSAVEGDAFSALTLTKPGAFESGCTFVWDATDLEKKDIKNGSILKLTFDVSKDAKANEKYIISAICEDPVDKDLNPVKISTQSGSISIGDSNTVVDNELESIEASKVKTVYNLGEQLDIDDLVVTALYKGGVTKAVDSYTTNIQDINMNEEGEKILKISYTEGDKTCESDVEITVNKKEENKVLDSISATKVKKTYNVGDQLNIDDIVVTATYDDGSTNGVEEFITDASKVDMNSQGEKNLKISYTEDGVTCEYVIVLTINKPEDIEKPENPDNPKDPDKPEQPSDQQKPTESPSVTPTENPVIKPTETPATDQPKAEDGVGTISADGKTLIDEDGTKYLVAEKVTADQLNKNAFIADKKSGKYKITKITKKKGKVTGGTVTYTKPYNKNCKTATVKDTVKIAGVTFKVTAVANNAFKDCAKLTKVTIGKKVTQIGKNAFNGCTSLKKVIIKATNLKKVGANAFKDINSKAKFKLYKKKYTKYKKMIKKAKAPSTAKYSK